MNQVFKGLGAIYSSAMDLRNKLYDKGRLKSVSLDIPVVSVGNITMGGTGKTPIVDWLLNSLKDRKLKIAVVSRAYKAQASEPCLVDLSAKNPAAIYGDEVVMLASFHPEVDFYSGQVKSDIAAFATSQKKYDMMIVDDGFQHRRLSRDIDIVLLDATEKIENYQVVPAGRAREDFSSLRRAQLVFITKVNQIGDGDIHTLRKLIPSDIPVVEFKSSINGFMNLSGNFVSLVNFPSRKVYLAAGIARPEVFEKMMSDLRFEIVGTQWFGDHEAIDLEALENLKQNAKLHEAILVVTAKDAIKFKDFPEAIKNNVYFASLAMEPSQSEEKVYEILSKILPG